tara:strand:- start:1658 stop:1834 length:177 start_codon:yes stop_codon:yes gene_type:complete
LVLFTFGGLDTATFFIGEDIFRIPVESTLISAIIGGGFLGLAGFYYLFNKLDKNTLNA